MDNSELQVFATDASWTWSDGIPRRSTLYVKARTAEEAMLIAGKVKHIELQIFDIEAYWGSDDGTLWHGTIHVLAMSMIEAMGMARDKQLIPEKPDEHYEACAKPYYFEDHYDIEPIGDEFDDIRMGELGRLIGGLI